MKKKVLFLSICAVLLLTSQVFADSISLIGKKVAGESEVTLNGVQIKSAIIVENSAYAPLRDIAESLNVDLTFEKSDKGSEIKMESPKTKEVTKEYVWKKAGLEANIQGANDTIEQSNESIVYANKQLENATHEILVKTLERSISEAQERIIQAQQDIITYTNELLALETAE